MYIHIRVTAGAKRETITKADSTHFRISVREPAKRNLANKKIMEIISREFKVPVSVIRIISGHHSPSKIISVDCF